VSISTTIGSIRWSAIGTDPQLEWQAGELAGICGIQRVGERWLNEVEWLGTITSKSGTVLATATLETCFGFWTDHLGDDLNRTLELGQISVHPEYREHGLARALIKTAVPTATHLLGKGLVTCTSVGSPLRSTFDGMAYRGLPHDDMHGQPSILWWLYNPRRTS
jgi:GNAT superfamily N-acetyltransferase